jgi:hypothetical protein
MQRSTAETVASRLHAAEDVEAAAMIRDLRRLAIAMQSVAQDQARGRSVFHGDTQTIMDLAPLLKPME